jgi:hypothetical protein
MAVLSLAAMRFVAQVAEIQRHEGKGTGDGVRLRSRSKALKGKPQERIRSEIWPAGAAAVKRQEVEKT